MTAQQKVAWFNLTVLTAAVAVYLGLLPFLGAGPALGAFGLCGLWGLTVLFYRRRSGEVLVDERDALISARAQLAGLWIFWECWIAVCMITWAVLRFVKHQETVAVDVLPQMVGGGTIVFVLVHSVATLLQYQRRRGLEG